METAGVLIGSREENICRLSREALTLPRAPREKSSNSPKKIHVTDRFIPGRRLMLDRCRCRALLRAAGLPDCPCDW